MYNCITCTLLYGVTASSTASNTYNCKAKLVVSLLHVKHTQGRVYHRSCKHLQITETSLAAFPLFTFCRRPSEIPIRQFSEAYIIHFGYCLFNLRCTRSTQQCDVKVFSPNFQLTLLDNVIIFAQIFFFYSKCSLLFQ
jgi:hypothetical protein